MTPHSPDVAAMAKGLSEAGKRNLRALPRHLGTRATVSEMRAAGATGSGMDLLYVGHIARDRRLCDRTWATWGHEQGQKRGEGYEYSITPLGLAVRAYLLEGE